MTLFQTFVDAFEAEWARYVIQYASLIGCDQVCLRTPGATSMPFIRGTRAQCERWIAEKAARKGFKAMRDALLGKPGGVSAIELLQSQFLYDLAAKPETTSGDAENDHGG